MSNKEKFKKTFAQISLSEDVLDEVKNAGETKKKFRKRNVVAACLAAVFILGAGGATVLGNMEIKIDSDDYCMRPYFGSNSWSDCQWHMRHLGVTLPKEFGEYEFSSFDTVLVARQGTTYLEALLQNVYKPTSIYYGSLNVYVGTLDEDYWPAYFRFENVDGVWVASEADISFEYEGMTVYGELHNFNGIDQEWEEMSWSWVDEKTGVCWSVWEYVDTGTDSELVGQEVVKEIIDLNK